MTLKIHKGNILKTMTGCIEIMRFNGSIVDVNETYIDIYDENEIFKTVDRRYTLNEIAALLHDYDGLNYRVIWDALPDGASLKNEEV